MLNAELTGSKKLKRFNLYFPKAALKESAILISKYPATYKVKNKSSAIIKKSFMSLKKISFSNFKLNILNNE